MLLEEFLSEFVCALEEKQVAHCVLRNYEGLPHKNIGNDIDFLICPEDSGVVVDVLRRNSSVEITGFLPRQCAFSVFLSGVNCGKGRNAIQLDFLTSLSWKGLPYLSNSLVLDNLEPVGSSGVGLKKPVSYIEAINTFFSSYLIGGWIKDKYQLGVRRVFKHERQLVVETLTMFMPRDFVCQFVDKVVDDRRDELLSLLPKVRRYLFFARVKDGSRKAIRSIISHYACELKIRCTPYPVDSVCLLGPDGVGKSTVYSSIKRNLRGATKEVAYRHLKPSLNRQDNDSVSSTDNPHMMPPRSAVTSIGKLISWIFLYWKDHFFHGHKTLTLRFWDRYFYDVFVDPRRYRYGAPLWAAKLLGKLIPKPGLIIVLDAPTDTIQSRKKEVTLSETERQRALYLEFAGDHRNCVVLDTSQDIGETVKSGTQAVLTYLTNSQLARMKKIGFS